MRVKSLAFAFCPSFLRSALDRLESSPIGCRLARGVFWSTTGAVITRCFGVATAILIARILGKEVFGEYGMIRSTVDMFFVVAGFGLGVTATKHVAEFRDRDPGRAGRIIGLSGLSTTFAGGLIASGLFVLAPWLAGHTINAPHLTGALRISALLLFIHSLNDVQIGTLYGLEAFRATTRVSLFAGLFSFPVMVVGAYWGNLTGLMWASVISLGATWLLNHVVLRGELRRYGISFTLKDCRRELPILWKFTVPAVITSCLFTPVTWACRALLVNEPNGYDEMGVFNAANQWLVLVAFLPGMLGRVILPILSERLGQNDTRQSLRTMLLGVKINVMLVLPILVLGSIASPFIMGFYGDGFRSGWLTLIVIFLTAGLMACNAPIAQVIAASGRMWTAFGMNVVWASIYIVGTILLVHYGAFGLAVAGAVAHFVQTGAFVAFALWLLRDMRNHGTPDAEEAATPDYR